MLRWEAIGSTLPFTTPTLLWVTEPHLYFGVVTVDFTLTLSPIFIWERELCGGNPEKNKQKPNTCQRVCHGLSSDNYSITNIRPHKNTITHAYQVARCGCSGPSMFLLSAASHTAHLSHEVHLCPTWSLSRHLRHTLPRTFYSTSPSFPPAQKLLTRQSLNLCPIGLMWLKAAALTWMFSLTYTA